MDAEEIELQRQLDATEDFDERKRIRAKLMEVKKASRLKRTAMVDNREQAREDHIRQKQAEAMSHKKNVLAMYDQMAKSAPAGSAKSMDVGIYKDGMAGNEPIVAPKQNQVEDVIQQTKREADDRKKRILAAYDYAAKTQPAGTIKVVNFDAFKRADVSEFDPDANGPNSTFGAAGGIPKVNKGTAGKAVNPNGSIDPRFNAGNEPANLNYSQQMIKQRQEEANDNKRRIMNAYATAAKQGGPRSVLLSDYR